MKGALAVWADLTLKFVATNRRRLLRRCLVNEKQYTQQTLGEVNACCAEARSNRAGVLLESFPALKKNEKTKKEFLYQSPRPDSFHACGCRHIRPYI
jgi:hypothetical protein